MHVYHCLFKIRQSKNHLLWNGFAEKLEFDQLLQPLAAIADLCILTRGESSLLEYKSSVGKIPASHFKIYTWAEIAFRAKKKFLYIAFGVYIHYWLRDA